MFEVSGTHFEKGTFTLDLERRATGALGVVARLGPIRARLVALSFILLGGFLTIKNQPAFWLVQRGWLEAATVPQFQKALTWIVSLIGFGIYLLAILRRPETLKLAFDRSQRQFRFVHTPGGRHARAQEGVFPFEAIEAVELFGAGREPRTPHGFAELRLKGDLAPADYRRFRFSFLTDDQFRFFPANIARLTGYKPVGDYKDPDDELAGQ